MTTEGATINISTSSKCDLYTSYVNQNFDIIAHEAANGSGKHLNLLASFEGCPVHSHEIFAYELKKNYTEIFNKDFETKRFHSKILNVVETNQFLNQQCNIEGSGI